MKKSGFKTKQRKPMKRSGFKTSKGFMEIHKAKTGFLEGVPVAVFKTNLKRTPFKKKFWADSLIRNAKPIVVNSGNVHTDVELLDFIIKDYPGKKSPLQGLKGYGFKKKILKQGLTGKWEGEEIYKPGQPLFKPRTPLNRGKSKLRRTKLRLVGHSSTTELKNEIQALLRQIAIRRDGGCILRHYKSEITPRYQECGGYRKDGELILQAEHLHTRSNLSTFADTRLIVCLCKRHHGYYKPQYSDEYYEIVKKHIGKERADLLKRVKEDRGVHRGIDLKMELLNLKKELLKLGPEELKINN